MADPVVSIVIPVYNRKEQLGRALKSVLNQTFQHFEVLVVDDFSTDNIKKVVSEFNDDRFRYYRLEKKGNANVARNLGIRKAKGEYIAFLDSDDEWLPIHLERRIAKIREWGCDGIFGSAVINNDGDTRIKLSRELNSHEFPLDYVLSDGFAPTPSMFVTRDSAKFIQWNETLQRHQDYDFFLRYCQHFNFRADYEPTIIVNWEGVRKVNYKACMEFMDLHKHKIQPKTYMKYLFFMWGYARNMSKDDHIAQLYRKEILSFSKYLSLMEYLKLYQNKSALRIQWIKVNYFIDVFFRKNLNLLNPAVKNNSHQENNKKLKEHHQKEIAKIKNIDFTIISSNCWGGSVYEDLKMQYLTPTVGLFFYAPCYIRFLKSLKESLKARIDFKHISKYPEANQFRNQNFAYPIGVLPGDIEIHFLHYKSEMEAKEKWERRKERVNWDNLFVTCTDRDLMNPELMKEFDELEFKNKVLFVAEKQNFKCSELLEEFEGEGEVGDLYNDSYKVTKGFSLSNWLNNTN